MKLIEAVGFAAIIATGLSFNSAHADYLNDMNDYINTKSKLGNACTKEIDKGHPSYACEALIDHIKFHPGSMPSVVAKQIDTAERTYSMDTSQYDRLEQANKDADYALAKLAAYHEAGEATPDFTMTDGFRPPRMLGVVDIYNRKAK